MKKKIELPFWKIVVGYFVSNLTSVVAYYLVQHLTVSVTLSWR